jgi:hypothetical protein
MRKRKEDLLGVQNSERTKLIWKARRQVQQKMLEEKLMQCYLEKRSGRECSIHYPESMDPLIEDFMRKADEQMKRITLYLV